MRALILAAGKGTRLRPLTKNTPKCLLKVKGDILLNIWIKKILVNNIDEIFINSHYLHEQVESYITQHEKSEKIRLLYEKNLLGTAGTLIQNVDNFIDDDLLLIHGDNYMEEDLNNLINAHYSKPKSCLMTMLSFETKTPHTCGIIEVDNNGILKSFTEKPLNSNNFIANAAIYILSKEMIQNLKSNDGTIYDFSLDIIPKYLNKIFVYFTKQKFIDIGNIHAYKAAQEL